MGVEGTLENQLARVEQKLIDNKRTRDELYSEWIWLSSQRHNIKHRLGHYDDIELQDRLNMLGIHNKNPA